MTAEVLERIEAVVKPRLRGWLHAGMFPVVVVCGIVLVSVAPAGRPRVASAVFAVAAALMFGVSAAYHRGTWGPRMHEFLKRMDHANIFLIIAASCTPFALLVLDDDRGQLMLWIVWSGALVGVLFRTVFIHAARWLSAPAYLALGWTAVFFIGDFVSAGAIATLVLVIVGGALYSLGGVIYGIKRPNPSPRWFGFHEVFHSFTLGGWIVHYVAVSIVAYSYG
jgi:hemolysin III